MSIIKVHYYQNHPLMSIKTLLSLCLYLYPVPVSSLSLLLVPFFSSYTAPSITSQLSPSNFRIQGMILVFSMVHYNTILNFTGALLCLTVPQNPCICHWQTKLKSWLDLLLLGWPQTLTREHFYLPEIQQNNNSDIPPGQQSHRRKYLALSWQTLSNY